MAISVASGVGVGVGVGCGVGSGVCTGSGVCAKMGSPKFSTFCRGACVAEGCSLGALEHAPSKRIRLHDSKKKVPAKVLPGLL